MAIRRLTAILSFTLITSAALAAGHTYVMDIPITTEKSVSFNVQEGKFVLRGDPSATTIRMEVSIDRFFIFRLGEQDILSKLIKVSRADDSVTVATDIPKSLLSFGRAQYPIDFVVTLPARLTLQLDDTSGDIEVSKLQGDVTIKDTSGALMVSRVAGNLKITKDSGDIKVDQVNGETNISSRTGQLQLDGLGKLTIEASDGNLNVSQVRSAEINNRSGNVKIQDVKGPLVLHDTSGEIVIHDVDGPVDVTDTSGQIRIGKTGAVTIKDTDGNITVENAPSLRVTAKESGDITVSHIEGEVNVPPNIKLKRKKGRLLPF